MGLRFNRKVFVSLSIFASFIFNTNVSANEDVFNEKAYLEDIASQQLEYPHYEVGTYFLKNHVNYEKALFWLVNSSDKEEYHKADYLIAEMYYNGKTPSAVIDYEKATFFYDRAARRGNSDAKLKLAANYAFNLDMKNKDRALFWLGESIKDRSETASLLYYLMSIQENDIEAVKKQLLYYEIKSEKGDADADFVLGYLNFVGKGVKRDLNLSKSYFLRSMNLGNIVAEIMVLQIDKLQSLKQR